MSRAASALSVAILAAAATAAPSPSRADACAPIIAAYEKLAVTPAYRQTITQGEEPPTETMAVGDVLYMKLGPEWQSVKLKPGGRLGMLQAVIGKGGGLTQCTEKLGETVGGVAAKVYTYQPPEIEGLGKVGGMQTVWIAEADGLPRRMTADRTEVAFAYDGVVAPPTKSR